MTDRERFRREYLILMTEYRDRFGHGPPCGLGDMLSPDESMPLMMAALEKGEPVPDWGPHRELGDVVGIADDQRSWARFDRELPPGDPVFKRGFKLS